MEVHINQLPLKRNYVVLEEEFHNELAERLLQVGGSIDGAGRLIGIADTTMGRIVKKESRRRIRLDSLLKILRLLNIPLEKAEDNVIWIGNNQSKGINNPKLPFNFNYRAAARFLAAICNDGWISDGAYYSNMKQESRNSVKEDALFVFGGNENTITEWVKEKDRYLAFPSIIRDVLVLITQFEGIKSENNPPVPSFILNNKELMFGWIEQTIADEGHVKHYPDEYRREIIWRRSFNKSLDVCRLNKDEQKMLDILGINYDVKNIGIYKTKKGVEKIRLHIRISKRENLLKLRNLIKIPDVKKDKVFTEMFSGFTRYKEPLRVKEAIIKLCKENGYVTSSGLRKEMNYTTTNCANKWLKFHLNEGLLKCIGKSYSRGFFGCIPAKYALVEP